jgi:hypothetical protein
MPAGSRASGRYIRYASLVHTSSGQPCKLLRFLYAHVCQSRQPIPMIVADAHFAGELPALLFAVPRRRRAAPEFRTYFGDKA